MPACAAHAEPAVQEFAVDRNGSPIGRHLLTFTPNRTGLGVDILIELEVKFAFITLYRYRHTNRELWEDGRLVSFASHTDDNGTAHRVEARRQGDVILVESAGGRVEAPGDAMPSTYWHRRFLDAPVWIDTQVGRLLSCKVAPTGPEQVLAAGRNLPADGFAVTGDLTLDLWYAKDHWVKLHFAGSDGSGIDYRLERAVPGLIAMAE
jgi:Family of unknown function (DUF6134)